MPNKRSATIEVVDERGQTMAQGRYGTDNAGYAEMLQDVGLLATRHEDRISDQSVRVAETGDVAA